MKTLRIIGVPEHFNYPFRLLAEEQPFLSQGTSINWTEESRGSGQMIQDLNQGKADLAILLTESFLKEVETNPNLKLLGFHVDSPLIWGVHVSPRVKVNSAAELSLPHFLISRMGSGSHLMAKVLVKSLENPWTESASFEIVGNLDGAILAMENGSQGMFLWEKYTTSPAVRAGKMNRIGELPSPWPCFVMVVRADSYKEFGEQLMDVRDWIYQKNRTLKDLTNLDSTLSDAYQLSIEDVRAWLNQTRWAEHTDLSSDRMEEIVVQLFDLGIIQKKLKPAEFILPSVLT